VAAGELGRIVHAEGNFCADRYRGVEPDSWKASPEQILPGALCDHMIYLMIEMIGRIAEVTVTATRQVATQVPLADVTAVQLKFAGGQTGALAAIGVTADLSRLHLFGSDGWAEMRDKTEFTQKRLSGKAERRELADLDAERAEMEAFADAVAGTAPFPV